MSSSRFHILYVCTGNICRSAVAERLLRREIGERLGDKAALIEVTSAGVQGLVGEPMDADTTAALRSLGGDETGFVARRMDLTHVREADLVLTANRKHRATVVRLDPSAARRAFTMREFGSLAQHVDLTRLPAGEATTRLKAVVDEAAAARGLVRPDARADFDVQDPYGGPPSLHRNVTDVIKESVTVTADLLAAAAQPGVTHSNGYIAPAPSRERLSATESPPRNEPRRRRWWPLAMIVPLLVIAGAAAYLAWSGLSAKRELEASRPLVSRAHQQVLAGNTVAAEESVRALQGHTSTALHRLSGPVWALAANAPYVGDDITAVRTVTRGVDDVAQGVLPQLLAVSDEVQLDRLRSGNRINLAAIERAAPAFRTSLRQTERIKATVDGIARSGLTRTVALAVADVRHNVDDLAASTATASQAAELVPPLLGADGKRRYFLAFQNPAEARGTGGLLGAYGVLEADSGRIRVLRLGSNTELRNPARRPIDVGADYRRLYGGSPVSWGNGNVSPHFPNAARIWTAMWRMQFGQRLDGVIATDPVALGYLLKATGSARLPNGDLISAANAAHLTMSDVYRRYPTAAEDPARDAYLQRVGAAVFDRLLSGQGDASSLIDQMTKAAHENRLLVYSTHPDQQRQLEQTAVSGVVPETERPFAGLVVNNYSGNKLDYYLDRTLNYRLSSCASADGTRPSTITVTLTNGAPKGLPPYVDQQLDTEDFTGKPPHSANTDYVQVFATRGAQLTGATLDGKPLLVTGAQQQGHPVFAFNMTLRSKQRRTAVLTLTEPSAPGKPLLMTPQPLVRGLSQQASTTRCGAAT